MESFDYIVIGGGSAGSAVTGRLSVDGTRRVCLIEAGGHNNNVWVKTPGFMPFIPQASNYRYETVPQKGLNGRTGYQPRGRGLGGSSAINAMVYIRGNRWDYDNWAAEGCAGWAYDDVLPYFKRAEANERGGDDFHGHGGPLFVEDQKHANPASRAFVEAAAALQLRTSTDFNGDRQDGFGLYQVTQHKGERWSAARAYVEPVRDQGNVSVRTDTLVEKLVIEGGRVTGVQILRKGKRETLLARRGVILSAGAFNSPQILMLSGIGPAEHLKAHGIDVVLDRPAVGGNLQDHIDYVSGWETDSDVPIGSTLKGTLRMAAAMVEHRMKRTGVMTTCYAEAGGFWTVMPDSPAPDVQWHFVPAVLEDHGREKVKAHGFSLHAWRAGLEGLAFAGAGCGAAFGIYLLLFLLRGMGAGDVKMMAAMGALIGWSNWLLLFALSAVIGGLVAVLTVLARGRLRQTLQNLRRLPQQKLGQPGSLALPHAPVVAVAALFTAIAMRGQ
jgi:choline dehydrogenase-like flavoprotein/Flp pilus assembly protein protease CpaA